jgi:hypothetical protein
MVGERGNLSGQGSECARKSQAKLFQIMASKEICYSNLKSNKNTSPSLYLSIYLSIYLRNKKSKKYVAANWRYWEL